MNNKRVISYDIFTFIKNNPEIYYNEGLKYI